MIIEVGLMFATYLGVRLFENAEDVRLKKKAAHRKQRAQSVVIDAEENDCNSGSGELTVQQAEEANKAELARLQHFKNTSSLAMMGFALRRVIPGAGLFGLGTYIYSAIPYMRDVEKQLTEKRKVNVDVLFFIGDVLTLGASQYLTAAIGLFLLHWGKLAVFLAKDDSKANLSGLFEKIPQHVWVLIGDVEKSVPLKDVQKGDIVVIESGGTVPVDGIVVAGMAGVDQHALTGESQPVEKEAGDSVYANTMVISGYLHVQVEKSGDETTSAQIATALLHATEFKTGVQLKGEEWADKATLPMLVASGFMLPTMGAQATVVFINSHIGNRIRLLAPMSTLTHISHALNRGILIKDGRILENLHKVDTILFDKTGTLTLEEPEVARVMTLEGFSERQLLQFAANAEQKQGHPIAKAILKHAASLGILPHKHCESDYHIGFGIMVKMGDQVIRVGSMRFLEKEDINVPEEVYDYQNQSHREGHTLVMIAVGAHVAGCIELRPGVRPEVKAVIKRLRQQGIKQMAIVSGDHKEPTRRLAESLGMDAYYYNVLPEDKAALVSKLQAEGNSVGFVGDGINDTIAMKKANASVSLRGASTIATDMAEIILMNGDLTALNELFDVSRSLRQNLDRSLMFTLAPGVINLSGAFIFHYSIFTAIMVNFFFGTVAVFYANSVEDYVQGTQKGTLLLPAPAKKMTDDETMHRTHPEHEATSLVVSP